MNNLPCLTYENLPKQITYTKHIPKNIFRTCSFSLYKLPEAIYTNLIKVSKENPYYQQYYFDDNDVEKFIKKHYPNYYKYFIALRPGAFRADLWRLLILYKYGGIYNDIGHQYLKPIGEIIDHDNDEFIAVVDWEPKFAIHNAFIACYPKHPIIKHMIDYIITNISTYFYGNNPLEITGPFACGKAFNNFFGYPEYNLIKLGKYTINTYRVKFFFLDASKYHYNTIYIIDKEKNKLIKTKFDGYYNIIYDRKKLHYGEYYRRRQVYNNALYIFYKELNSTILTLSIFFIITIITCIYIKLMKLKQ